MTFSLVTRWISPALTVAALAAAGLSAQGPAVRLVSDDNPLAGQTFYADPNSAAMRAARSADPPNPQLMEVASTPTAYWLDQAFPTSTVGSTVSRYAGAAQAAGAMPVFAIYAIPHRDCGSYAAGGFGSADGYRGWIDAVAAGLGSLPATIVLEPDAVAHTKCLSDDQLQERFGLLKYAIEALTRDPAAVVYLDGGHSRWLGAEQLADRLKQSGVDEARGFALNSNNFFTTEEETGYGETVSGMLGGKPYVIDTSRNGAGPADGEYAWCNPSGRALGVPPTTDTAGAHTDAYLWVKRPGESDGSCGTGEPSAGQFVSQYAIDLARNAGR